MISNQFSVKNYQCKNTSSPSFSGVLGGFRCVKTATGDVFVQHTTCLFRIPEKLLELPKLLPERFPKGCPIIVHAGSDGSEAYSAAIVLHEKLGKTATSFFPIKAVELDPESVKFAQSGLIVLRRREMDLVKIHAGCSGEKYFSEVNIKPEEAYLYSKTPFHLRKYFPFIKEFKKLEREEIHESGILGSRLKANSVDNEKLYEVSNTLKKTVKFSRGDFLIDAKNPELFEKPCVFMLHNQLYHMLDKEKTVKTFFNDLFKSMKPGSLFLTEEREIRPYPGLYESGFKPLIPNEKSWVSGIYHRP